MIARAELRTVRNSVQVYKRQALLSSAFLEVASSVDLLRMKQYIGKIKQQGWGDELSRVMRALDEGQLVDIANDRIDAYLQVKLYKLMGLLRAKEVTKGSIGEGVIFRKRKHAVNEWSFGKFVDFVLKECKDEVSDNEEDEEDGDDYVELDIGEEDEDEGDGSDEDEASEKQPESIN